MVSKVRLHNFRNFDDKIIEFSPKTTVIVGPNASGKTNVLEAIYLLSTGKSFKASPQTEMINYDADIARVKGKIDEEVLEVVLTYGFIRRGSVEEKAPKKRLLVNDTPKRMIDFASHLTTVIFRPKDLELIDDAPSVRRSFLDDLLSQVDREYRRSLLNYEKGLRRRNKVLLQIREEGIPKNSLFFWDNLLVKNGDYIARARAEFVTFLNNQDSFNDMEFMVEYDRSAISAERLASYQDAEIASGNTLVGPHRDDLLFNIVKKKPRRLDSYGSRGEQRMAVLWAKIAELEYIREKSDSEPVLLLDDIFSELDHEHRDLVEDIFDKQQTVITSADPHYVEGLKDVVTINL